jgi:hypothetical protein
MFAMPGRDEYQIPEKKRMSVTDRPKKKKRRWIEGKSCTSET